jgi:hypothetical protein
MKQTIQGAGTTAMRKLLQSEHVDTGSLHIDKPSSDNGKAFFSFCKETFGEDIPVQQCSNHIGSTNPTALITRSKLFQTFETFQTRSKIFQEFETI